MTKQIRLLLILISCWITVYPYFDNRFLFPLNERITWRTKDKLSRFNVGAFFMTGDEARDEHYDIRLPDLGGQYDLAKINAAMNLVGITNPYYLTEWETLELPYVCNGKIRATGMDLAFEYGFNKHFSIGVATSIMHVNTRYDYRISDTAKTNLGICNGTTFYPGREWALEQARLNSNVLLGLNSGQWSATGLSDTELYVRVGTIKEYLWKFRQFDISLWLGALLPTGEKMSLSAQSAVPFGGNGHYGMFARGELALELTDDVFFGFWLYLSKRFSKIACHRMPMASEPLQYGVLVDQAKVDPGFSVAFSPYLIWDDIQDGFGAYGGYTYVQHTRDHWFYSGTTYCPKLNRLCDASKWINGYFTIGIDYDFTKGVTIREYGPRFYFDFTLPTTMFDSKCVFKTYRISLGMEFHF
ncbi:TPA: hypothetical protein DIC20_00455 [Candidatus Dependentiae bacterium]|nr:MAG: hypothetical protein US03_C0002G0059 [candidate division TM6 bacterium GW2011_GWF2_36_131]KKQ03493.1 MAG: hypothetical protein US13_C0002G0059 [candidate division TM6 bacterium GW2011_GWE2_36_25]KKQ20233.1 MAG: hypothetical protein US32_C0001G0130 [candidate division TM6 bacterium GW2011_GWA2_36_9]HBR70772.1 hypothetical protein [Candidatus Dependentiae bacterium]HCU00157.1 hypothetical protein [Candidatus Dependentiae bacterium]